MTTYLKSTRQVARKRYSCDACVWITESEPWQEQQLTLAELKEIVKARRNGWQIMPGQEYIRQAQIYEGRFYVWRAIPAIHAICLKYDIYEYD